MATGNTSISDVGSIIVINDNDPDCAGMSFIVIGVNYGYWSNFADVMYECWPLDDLGCPHYFWGKQCLPLGSKVLTSKNSRKVVKKV
jgi:hypothetical protein